MENEKKNEKMDYGSLEIRGSQTPHHLAVWEGLGVIGPVLGATEHRSVELDTAELE